MNLFVLAVNWALVSHAGVGESAGRMARLGEGGGLNFELVAHGAPPIGPVHNNHGGWTPPWGGAPGWEIFPCPPFAYPGYTIPWQNPYATPYQYIGYRWLRSDGSTCSPLPSDNLSFFEEATASAGLGADDAPRSLRLASREHRVARIFYRMPPEGGSVYYHDQVEFTGRASEVDVNFRVANRAANPPLPWESESISFAFDGLSVNARVQGAAYQYDINRSLSGSFPRVRADFTLTPLRKVLTRPDPLGIDGRLERTADGKSLKLVLADRWAAGYPGQTLRIAFVVKRNRRLWGDSKVAEGVAPFTTAAGYEIDLSKLALKEALKAGEEYYAEFSFKRLGNVTSTEDDSPTIKLQKLKF